jgi:hypothetical protein
MSHYVFQFFGLLLFAVLFTYWQSRNRLKPPPKERGFFIVRWPLAFQLLIVVFLVGMISGCVFCLWLQLATDEKGGAVLLFLAIPLLVLAVWGTLTGRARSEYNETTLVAYSALGIPRQFALSDFTRGGPVSWRGQEFSTEAGDKIYVNSYQTGGSALIDLLKRGVKETYFE